MTTRITNHILRALPDTLFRLIVPHLTHIQLPHATILLEQDGPIEHVYFPHAGMVSLVVHFSDDSSIEVAAVGREGIVGAGLADGTRQTPMRAIVQIEGRGSRMPVDQFFLFLEQSPLLRGTVNNHSEALLAQLVRTVACNAKHTAEARLSRWLLMVRDRVDSDTIELTQEFLGHMLGVQRTTVNLIAQSLQKAGLIRISRGRIEILDRPALEAAACECYAINRRHFIRLMPPPLD